MMQALQSKHTLVTECGSVGRHELQVAQELFD
jgi:hypothetical protein